MYSSRPLLLDHPPLVGDDDVDVVVAETLIEGHGVADDPHGLAAREAPQIADDRVEPFLRDADLDGLLAVEPLERGLDDLLKLLLVRVGNLERPGIGLDHVGQIARAVDHHDGDARLVEVVDEVAEDAEGFAALEVVGQVERDADRARAGLGHVEQSGRRDVRVGDARAAVDRAVPHAVRDGPHPHVAFELGRGLADDLQRVPLLVRHDGDAVRAAFDQLLEPFEIIHRQSSL